MEGTNFQLAPANASIEDLRQKIGVAQERRSYFERYLREVFQDYLQGKISREKYLKIEYENHDGKTIREWIIFYDDYIKKCEILISQNKKGRIIKNLFVFVVSLAMISLIIFSFYNIQPKFSGFAIGGSEVSSVVAIEEKDAEVNIIQHEAILGQPVKWTKTLSLDSSSNVKVNLPRNSDSIEVSKIIQLYSEQAGTLQKETSPFHEESLQSGKGFLSRITGGVIGTPEESEEMEKTIVVKDNGTNYEIVYETPAPEATEEETKTGKRVKISSSEDLHYENVLSFTELDESFAIEDPGRVRIYWVENDTYLEPIKVLDSDANGIYDYVEWITPHLSEQTFEIILITRAEHLDSNREFISDVYTEVKKLDDIWSEPINHGEYIRVTFEENLTSEKDITIFPRIISGNPTVEIYEKDGNSIIANFDSLIGNEYNQVLLTNLQGIQDTFDLRIIGGSVEFDYILDPILHFTGPLRSMDVEPLGNNTFVMAMINSSTTNITRSELSFTEYFTNGTIRRGPFHKDQTLGNVTAVSIEMINSTRIYIGWFDMHLLDELRAVYDITGTQVLGPTTIDGANGGSAADTCLAHFGSNGANRTFFGWVDQAEGDFDAVIVPDNSTTTAFVGETGIDATLNPVTNWSNHIDCRIINSSHAVTIRSDQGDVDATWNVYDFTMTNRIADSDLDDNIGVAGAVSVAVVGTGSNTTKRLAFAWYDGTDQDITYAINYSNNGTGVRVPTDINTTAGTGSRIDVATISNGTGPDNFVVVWYSQDADDIMAQTFDADGNSLTSQFSIDSSTNATGLFNETMVFGKNGGTGWSICPETWGVTYTNSTGASVFKTYFVNGSTWDGNGCPTPSAPSVAPVAQFGTNLADNHNRSNKSATFDLRVFDDVSVSYLRLYGNWTGSWTFNQTNTSPINATYWNITVDAIPQGKWTWAAWANDSQNNQAFSTANRTFTIDTSAPNITLPFYANGTIKTNIETLTLNISVSDVYTAISTCKIEVNGTNHTVAFSAGWCNTTSVPLTNLATGNRTINVYANDTLGNWGLNNSFVVKIHAAPVFTFIPENVSLWINGSLNVDFNATDDGTIDRYFINWTNNFTINSSTGTLTNSSVVLPGSYLINVSVNDTNDAINSTLYKVIVRSARTLPTGLGATVELNTTNTRPTYGHELIWEKPYSGHLDDFGGTVTENRIGYTAGKFGNRSVHAFDALNGTLLWSTTVGLSDGTPLIDGNFIYINTYNENASTNGVYKLWKSNGTIAAENHTCGGVGLQTGHVDSMAHSANLIYAGCKTDGKMYAFHKSNLTVSWTYDTLSAEGIVSTPLYFEDTLTFGTRNATIPFFQLNATNGSLIWNNSGWSDTDQVWDMQPSIKDGIIYMGSGAVGEGIGAFNFTNGSLIWNRTDLGDFFSQMAIYDGKVWAGGSTRGILYSLYKNNGTVYCSYNTSEGIYQGPSIVEDARGRGLIFFATIGSFGYTLNATDCSYISRFPSGGQGYSPPAISEGMVFYKFDDRNVSAFNIGEGGGEWSYIGHDSSGRSFSHDGLQRWDYVNATCSTNSNTTCNISNAYPLRDVNVTLLVNTTYSWYYSNGTALGYNKDNITIRIPQGSSTTIVLDPNPSLGTLNVNISLPADNANISQNSLFVINASVSCTGSSGQWCGEIYGTARYNASSANADTAINVTQGALPLFVKEEIDIGKATYTGFNFSTIIVENAQDLTFNGTHFFVIDSFGLAIHGFNATGDATGFLTNVSAQDSEPTGLAFNGTHFYVAGDFSETVYEYNSTGGYTGFSFNISNQTSQPTGIAINGTKFYLLGSTDVFEYHRNGTYTGFSFSIANEATGGSTVGVAVNNSRFYVLFGEGGPTVVEYDSRGASTRRNFSVSNQTGFPSGIAVYGEKLYAASSTDDSNQVYEYNISKFTATNLKAIPLTNLTVDHGVYNLSWIINATGSAASYRVDVLFNSTTYSQSIVANDTADRTITITGAANSAPTIGFVQAVSAQTPTEAGYTSVLLNFSVNDSDGSGNINLSSARVQFNKTGETTRTNYTCANIGSGGNGQMFTCNLSMWYFDEIGTWTINVSARDNSELSAENSTINFTYNLLTAMTLSPSSLSWPTVNLTAANISSSNDPITINNTGNSVNMSINLTAYNLRGETTTTQFIYANNFTIGNVTDGCAAGLGTTIPINATGKQINGTNFTKGNNSLLFGNQTSGQEQLFFCMRGIPDDSSAQSYSSSFYGSWEVRILLVALLSRKRKAKTIKDDRLFKALEIILEELKKDYSLNKNQVAEILTERLQDKHRVKKKDFLKILNEEKGTITIPTTIFTKGLGALESLVKYMKENLRMSYSEIARTISRDERTIWTAYKKAIEKKRQSFNIKAGTTIPISELQNREMTILESAIVYLKEKGFKFSEIAVMLQRDQRNIWTIYSRASKR